ncbi:MAG: RdgB/HAM1 family non-canonical purine NTP pyrophosphatase [Microcoleaceae cyanobacterium]
MIKTLVVATGNPGKLEEIQAYLCDLDVQLQLKPPEIEVEETGTTFLENSAIKAITVAQKTGKWAIADDSGLSVAALGGAPGLYSARYAATPALAIARVLKELENNPNRQAQFICAMSIARPDGSIAAQVEGYCPGEILHSLQGEGGFGYDPIFYVPAEGKTFAQLSPERKQAISHRGVAFQQLLPQLKQLLHQ